MQDLRKFLYEYSEFFFTVLKRKIDILKNERNVTNLRNFVFQNC